MIKYTVEGLDIIDGALFPSRNNREYYQNSVWSSENFGGRRSATLRKEKALERVLDPPL